MRDQYPRRPCEHDLAGIDLTRNPSVGIGAQRANSPGGDLPRAKRHRTHRKSALRKAGRAGRKPRLGEKHRQQLEQLLVAGPERLGYETPLWTCPHVAHLIEQESDVRYHEGHVWKILVSLGWGPQRPEGPARERKSRYRLGTTARRKVALFVS